MDLLEYQGKQFFASFDIPVSPGEAVTTVDEAVAAAEASDVVVACLGLPDAAETEGADRVLVLHKGRLLADGSPAEVTAALGEATLEAGFIARTH